MWLYLNRIFLERKKVLLGDSCAYTRVYMCVYMCAVHGVFHLKYVSGFFPWLYTETVIILFAHFF